MKNLDIDCIVLSYNSSKTIIETLNSIKSQTILPKVLIINDDFSDDETIMIIEKWISENQSQFICIKFIKSNIRNGSVKSLKNAFKHVKSNWVKPMAADDILENNYFESIRNKIIKHKFDILICNPKFIDIHSKLLNFDKSYYFDCLPILFNIGRPLLRYIIKFRMIIPSSTATFSTKVLNEIIDLRFKLIEDWPMWNIILKSNYRVMYCRSRLFKYRIQDQQVTSNPQDKLTKKWIQEDLKNFKHIYTERLNYFEKILYLLHNLFLLPILLLRPCKKKYTRLANGLISLKLIKLINPIYLKLNKLKNYYILK